MKKLISNKFILTTVALAMLIAILLPVAAFAAVTNQTPVGVVGTLKFQGSTTVGPVIVSSIDAYNTYRGSTVITVGNIIQNGSGDGRSAAVQHVTDIGMSSSPVTEGTLTAHAIARDGIVFIVNSSVTGIQNMTKAQIDDIYEGRKFNWNQITDPVTSVVGPNMAITPRARIIGSGTRAAWKDVVGLSYASPDVDPAYDGLWVAGTSTTENRVIAQTQLARFVENVNVQAAINDAGATGQCGYVGLGFDEGANIKKINVYHNGVSWAPTGINIYSGTGTTANYPFARFIYVAVPNDYSPLPANWTTDVQNYISWIRATDGAGQQAVVDTGFLRLIPNQDVDSNNGIDVLDLIGVGNKVGQTTNLGRSDVDRNGAVDVLDLISVGNWVGVSIIPS